MGYMGLSHWVEIDGAADFVHRIRGLITAAVAEEMNEEGNEYNPPGVINILVTAKSFPAIAAMVPKKYSDKILAEGQWFVKHFEGKDKAEFRKNINAAIKSWVNARKNDCLDEP